MIAYRNPALQSDIVKARGLITYDHVAELVNLGFVIKERLGRSYMLKLSEKFYEYFELDGNKVKEVFQPVKDRIDEQLLLGNLKVVNTKIDSNEKVDIFAKSEEERLGDLEVIRIENQEHAGKINSLRDNHRGFLDNIEDQIKEISQRTDVEEEGIQSIRDSDVQSKINDLKSDGEDSDGSITLEIESDDETDDENNDENNIEDSFEKEDDEVNESDSNKLETEESDDKETKTTEDSTNNDNVLDSAAEEIEKLTHPEDEDENKND
jgi:hypothetical protein